MVALDNGGGCGGREALQTLQRVCHLANRLGGFRVLCFGFGTKAELNAKTSSVFLKTLTQICTLMYKSKVNIKLVYIKISLYRKISLHCVY